MAVHEQRVPPAQLPVVFINAQAFSQKPASGLRITCLGHATFLVELDGQVILTDLVRGERAYSLSLGSAQSASIARLFHWQTSLH
jgi:hypothetical protein